MMKITYKKIFSLLIVAGISFSVSALAINATPDENKKADNQQKKADRVAEINENVCERISERADKFSQKMLEEENRFRTRSEERLGNWTDKKTEKETALNAKRATWDANREEQFSALEAKATTDEQKKAVADFKLKTKTAITTRRSAMDSAIKTFQAGMQTAIATRQGQIDQLISTSRTSRQTLLDKAKADCGSGVDAKTVMANFKSGMQANREKLQADRKNVEKMNVKVAALIEARKQAVEKALADFKASMEQARIQLKETFKGDVDEVAATPTPVATATPVATPAPVTTNN